MSEVFDAYYKWLGIPPKDQPPNHYRLLGVELYEADPQVIDLACDRQVRHVRTFQMGKYSEHSQRLLDELASAKDCLQSPKEKAAYDAQLKQKLADAATTSEGVKAIPPPRMPSIVIAASDKPLVRKKSGRNWLVPVLGLAGVLAVAGMGIVFSMKAGEDPDEIETGETVPAAEAVSAEFSSTEKPDKKTAPERSAPPERKGETATPVATVKPSGKTPAATAQQRTRQNDAALEKLLDPARDQDLLALIDPQRDGRGKDWRLDGRVLVTPASAAQARLRIPGRFPEEYALTIVAERTADRGTLQLALSDGKENKLLSMDESVWAKRPAEQSGASQGAGSRTLVLTVLKSNLLMSLDGDEFFKAANSMQIPSEATPLNRQVSLFVKEGEFRISRLTLAPPSSADSSNDPAGKSNSSGNPGSKMATTKTPEPAAEPVARLPIPDASDLAKAERELKEVFREDFSKAKAASDKMVLAGVLLKQALATRDNPATKYVLLQYARDLAAQGGDIRSALDAIDMASTSFEVDEWDLKAQVLSTVFKQRGENSAKQAALEIVVDLMETCVDNQNFDSAVKLGNLVNSASTKLLDAVLRKKLSTRVAEVKRLRQMWAAVQESPDDPGANLKYSKYLCCTKGDWEHGLPMLAKGGDARLSPVAKRDLSAPTDAEQRAKLGDAWWELSEKEPAIRKSLQSRAGYWYEKAIPEATGLNKALMEKRLSSIDRTPPPTATVRPPAATPAAAPGGRGAPAGGAPAQQKPTDDRSIAGTLIDSGVVVTLRGPQINKQAKTREEIPSVPVTIVAVSIPEESMAGDAALGPLESLGGLETLDLSGPQISDAGLILASRTTSISNLTIGAATKITDRGLEVLGRLPKLVVLQLHGSRFGNSSMQYVGKAAGLRFLELTETKITGDGLRPLAQLGALQRLQFKQVPLADNDLAHLAPLTKLQQLTIDESPISGEGFKHLKASQGIQTLSLPRSKITNVGLQQIASFSALQNLDLSETAISGEGFRLMRSIANLRNLQLNGTGIRDEDLAGLAGCVNLRNLQLRSTQIAGDGFKDLPEGLPELRNLALEQSPVTNNGLKEIVLKVPKLGQLNLNLTRITDDGLANLQKLDNLNRLSLVGTQISEKGLTHLQGLSQLRNVELPEGRISETAVEKLQQALPQCTVQRN